MGRGIPGDLTGELTKGLGGNFRAPSEHTFSKSIVLVMPDVFLKLRGLKQCPTWGRGEGTGFGWPRHPGDPAREFPKGFQRGLRIPPQGMLSVNF